MKRLSTWSVLLVSTSLWVGCIGPAVDTDGEESEAQSEQETEPGEWELVWSDEFDGEAGELPDPTKWRFDIGGSGWGNQQLEFDTDRPENASMDGNGNLVLRAIAEPWPPEAPTNSYTSARLNTSGLFEQTYGRFEARMKMPLGRGLWPAFWLLGANFNEVGWPQCGEIDIMEYRGQEPWIVHGSMHGPGYSGGQPISDSYTLPDDGDFSEDFHVFTVEWEPERISFYVDSDLYNVVTPASLPPGTEWVYEHEFFILLNFAIGGSYVGNPDNSTVFPSEVVVDYVRVYERGS